MRHYNILLKKIQTWLSRFDKQDAHVLKLCCYCAACSLNFVFDNACSNLFIIHNDISKIH